jgi:hypothetical protein
MSKNDMTQCRLIKKAANTPDPVERMKLVLQFYVQTQFYNPTILQCRAPLNPILGETYQREMATGEKFYAEQISHHPPITSFLLEDPDGDYTFHGWSEFKAWLSGPTSLGGSREGVWTINFKDGGVIKFMKNPILTITGLLNHPQVQNFYGHAELHDITNGIIGDIHYSPWADNSYRGSAMANLRWAFGVKKKQNSEGPPKRDDDLLLSITKNEYD